MDVDMCVRTYVGMHLSGFFTIVHIKSHDNMRSVFVHVCIGIMLHLSGYDCVLCLWLSVFALQVPLTINSKFPSVEMLRCSKLPLPPPPSPSLPLPLLSSYGSTWHNH